MIACGSDINLVIPKTLAAFHGSEDVQHQRDQSQDRIQTGRGGDIPLRNQTAVHPTTPFNFSKALRTAHKKIYSMITVTASDILGPSRAASVIVPDSYISYYNGRAYHRDARQMDLSEIDPEFEELNQGFEDDVHVLQYQIMPATIMKEI